MAEGKVQPQIGHFYVALRTFVGMYPKTGLTQREFAQMIQISTRTLQNGEQKRRNPTGSAAALLKIVSAVPEVVLRSLHVV